MNPNASIKAVITAEDRASKTLQGFGGTLSKLGGIAKRVAKVGLLGLAGAAAWATKQFIDQEKATAQLNAVLRSTKGVAGVTSKAALKLADSLQTVTTFADEQILAGENLLLTFTKIGKDIFPDATETMLDMSEALGQDVKNSAIQLGKALQDPILGVTALRRVGVNFSAKQKDVIKDLVETGQAAKAQQIILKELKTEFGGSARAAADTFGGSLKRLKNLAGEAAEMIGGALAESLDRYTGAVLKWLSSDTTAKHIQNFMNKVQSLITVLNDTVIMVAQFLSPKVKELMGHLRMLWLEVIQPMIPVVGVLLVAALATLIDILNILIPFITDNKVAVWGLVGAIIAWKVAMAISKVVTAFTASMAIVRGATNAAAARFLFLGATVGAIPAAIGIAVAVAGIASVIIAFQELRRAIDNARDSADQAAASYARYQKKVGKKTGLRPEAGGYLPSNIKFGKPRKKQLGGLITAGKPYLVGEAGPEIIRPNKNSKVIPNHKLGSQMRGATHYHFHIGHLIANGVQERKFAERIVKNIQDIASMKGTTATSLLG